jgi:serine/threonine protein kinase
MLDNEGRPIELGRGAMGVTYKALDVDLRCQVTLKAINERYLGDESAQLRFLREARSAASVRHPNVASVLHLGRTGTSYFYAMEFVEGQTLESLIRRSGKRTNREPVPSRQPDSAYPKRGVFLLHRLRKFRFPKFDG